jgi:cytosine/adenosine deaminase-related metal-dependent hydrolase
MAKADSIPDPSLDLQEDSPQTAVQQQGDRAWPVPGDEGYVHPDGTPQSVAQMENNARAAADRAAAGSIIHGAPAATPGPQLQSEAAAAVRRAEAESPVTPKEARQGLAEFVEEGFVRATEKAEESDQPVQTSAATTPREAKADATKRTATTDAGKTTR